MVDGIEAAISAVTRYGGTSVQPVSMDAPEITARFRDPDGNVIGLYQPPRPRERQRRTGGEPIS